MFNNDHKLMPRTYSIKSYKKRRNVSIKRILGYSVILIAFIAFAGITILSAFKLI